MKGKSNRGKRWSCAILAIALAIAVGVTFMPLSGNTAKAKNSSAADQAKQAEQAGQTQDKLMLVNEDGTETEIDPSAIQPNSDVAIQKALAKTQAAAPYEEEQQDAEEISGAKAGNIVSADQGPEVVKGTATAAAKPRGDKQLTANAVPSPKYSFNKKTGKLHIYGSISGFDTYLGIEVDDTVAYWGYSWDQSGSTYLDIYLDMKDYDVGYHDIYIYTTGFYDWARDQGEENQWTYVIRKIPTYIYGKPSNGKSQYEVYWNKLYFSTGSAYSNDSSVPQYMDIRQKGKKKWSKWKTFGPMDSNDRYVKKKLKGKKWHQAKVYYGKNVYYKGKKYFFTGKTMGKVSKVQKFKTGVPSKLKVKSLKTKIYKKKKYRIRHYGRYTGVYLYTETIYRYKVKVVLKLKKKPGAKGIYMNSKRFKGNKKKYVYKIPSDPAGWGVSYWFYSQTKPKKPKYKFLLVSYQDKTYGGYCKPKIKKAK